MNTEEEILDNPQQKPSPRWFSTQAPRVLALIVIVLSITFRLQHWPFYRLLFIAGALLYVAHTTWLFFRQSRAPFHWLFYIGQWGLMFYLFLKMFFNIHKHMELVALSLFGLGCVCYMFGWPPGKVTLQDDTQEIDEPQT
ncbi:MAG: hypothetical protein ACKVOR_11680 [Flavobacteriales bacterium]